ncbi:MAG: KOW domain-containing RNA-binding protein [Clostridia bacterium]
MDTDLVGRTALSIAGRDKGRNFIIVGAPDPQHVWVVDGTLRKLDNPKKKKLKHIRFYDITAEGIKEKINGKKPVFDAEIRKYLLNTFLVESKEE